MFDKANIIIPCAGASNRFKDAGYQINKPFLPMGGQSMIASVCSNLYHPNLTFYFVTNKQNTDIDKLFEEIKSVLKDSVFHMISVEALTQGPACSCLLAKDLINNETPLFITNCDQIIEDLNYEEFYEYAKFHDSDGILGAFHSRSPKNSYMRVNDNNEVIEVKEKSVISDLATNGFHFWKQGKFFVESAEQMIANNDTVNGEYYVSTSYSYMLKNSMKVNPYYFNMHFPIGIPEDYENYLRWRNL